MSETLQPKRISSTTWFITGVRRGLGRAIAEEVLRRGGKVAGTVRSLDHGDELKRQFPGQVWIGELELSDLANISKVFQSATQHCGRIHAVVSNAAYSLLGAAEELQLDSIRDIVDTNLIGSIELARAAVTHMRPLGGGRLIQISSGAGQSSFPGLSLYCATKWGIEGFFDALSQEIAPFQIQTTLVEPGTIRTDFGASGVISPELDAYRDSPVGALRKMASAGYAAPGDPVKMAKAIVDTFEADTAPPRLALGPDVYSYIKEALTSRLLQLESLKGLTMSTNCDDAQEAS